MVDNKEDDELLLQADAAESPIPGPLLLWRRGPVQSIATVVFYARRRVQQVQLEQPATATERNGYRFDPETLEQAAGDEPRLILLDKDLLPLLPADLRITPVRESAHFILGTMARRAHGGT